MSLEVLNFTNSRCQRIKSLNFRKNNSCSIASYCQNGVIYYPAASLIADVYRSRSASLRGELTSRSYFTALVAAGSVFWEYAATCLKDLRQAPIRKGIFLFHLMGFAWPQDCLVLFIIPRLFVADSHSGRMSFGDCRCLWIQ